MNRKNIRELICQSLELNGYDPEEAQRIFLLEMGVVKYFQFEEVMPACLGLENIERDEKSINYYWSSRSDQAECPNCHEISRHERKDFVRKPVQDIASEGCAGIVPILGWMPESIGNTSFFEGLCRS